MPVALLHAKNGKIFRGEDDNGISSISTGAYAFGNPTRSQRNCSRILAVISGIQGTVLVDGLSTGVIESLIPSVLALSLPVLFKVKQDSVPSIKSPTARFYTCAPPSGKYTYFSTESGPEFVGDHRDAEEANEAWWKLRVSLFPIDVPWVSFGKVYAASVLQKFKVSVFGSSHAFDFLVSNGPIYVGSRTPTVIPGFTRIPTVPVLLLTQLCARVIECNRYRNESIFRLTGYTDPVFNLICIPVHGDEGVAFSPLDLEFSEVPVGDSAPEEIQAFNARPFDADD